MKSTLLKSIRYDSENKAMLVVYQDGARFRYYGGSPGLVAAIKRHPRPGEVFLKIRDNYPHERVKD